MVTQQLDAASARYEARGDASPVLEYLEGLLEEYQGLDDGHVATYIPELGQADPSQFGICLVTVDGHRYAVGDTDVEFTIQSISKPFVFGMALEDHGRDAVLERVGVEPSGNAFNSIVVDATSRPYNPMVNAGAIVTTGLVGSGAEGSPFDRILASLAAYAGHALSVDEDVYESERATGDRNRAIAYLMRSFAAIEGDVDAVVDAYFRQCSVLVSCVDLAMMAATLANRGQNPVTGGRALAARHVEHVLSVMSTCGMYDYAGEWPYTVGLPAKSGVSGGVIAVLPGQLGIGVFSPRLDERGNSTRGIKVCQRIAADFDLHPLRFQPETGGAVRRSYHCSTTRSSRVRSRPEEALLGTMSGSVAIYELQGDLFFGSADRLFRTVIEDHAETRYVVLDCKRLRAVDASAGSILRALETALDARGCQLLLADVAVPEWGTSLEAPSHSNADAALEWCENQLLDSGPSLLNFASADGLKNQELLEGLTGEELAAVEGATETRVVEPGEVVFREGEQADSLCFVLSGLVSVRLPLHAGLPSSEPESARARDRQLATLGPGVAFGELAILDDGRRSADVVAEVATVLAELPIAALRDLAADHPELITKVYANLARNLAGRLRRANDQVRTLAQ